MPIIHDPEPFDPLAAVGKPQGLIVTRDQFSPPISDFPNDPTNAPTLAAKDTFGQRGTPTWGETIDSSMRLHNPLVAIGEWIENTAQNRDFGPYDPTHNPWDSIKDDPKYGPYWDAFANSRNSAETEYIRSRLDRQIEDRRINAASGFPGFVTDLGAAVLSPTNLGPLALAGRIYSGYLRGSTALRSVASVGGAAGAATFIDEMILHSQQETRTWLETLTAVGGATLLGGLLGGALSARGSAGLARAVRQLDSLTTSATLEARAVDALRLTQLEELARTRTLTELELAERQLLASRLSDAPFGQSVGAAVSREIQENIPESAFGLERLFAFQGPAPRAMASSIKTVRDVMTRLADIPGILKQNKEGIPTGPAGGSVEMRIKTTGDIALYRMQEGLYGNFAEYRFGNREAAFARSRAAFSDLTKQTAPDVMDWRDFKAAVTKALREQTERGIEHPVPQVKAAAETVRKEVFEPFKKEALKLGMFPKEAELSWNYVTRRWNVDEIMRQYDRFKGILLEHLRGGQAKARSDLARIEKAIQAERNAGNLVPEVQSLSRQLEAERQRFAVDQATVQAVVDMWRLVVKERPKKPLSLVAWLKRNGGLRDEGNALAHMLGSRREAGRLIRKDGMALDDAGLRAFEKGYFPERPTISELLDAIDDDMRSGGTRFSELDAEAAETWRIAEEYREELERYGIAGARSEKQAQRMITARLREEAKSPAHKAVQEGMDADRAFLAELERMEGDNPEAKAAIEDAKAETQARLDDAEQSAKRMGDDPETLLAAGVPVSFVRKIVESGKTYRFSDDTIMANMEAAAPYADALPAGVRMGTWASVGPSPRGKAWVSVTFRTLTGDVGGDITAEMAFTTRAIYFPSLGTVIPNALGERLGAEGHVASGIYHEAVHAHLRMLPPELVDGLVVHAQNLRVLDMQLGTFLRVIGHPTWQNAPDVTLRKRYMDLYADDPPEMQAHRLAQEAVAHMQELHFNGHFSDADVAPVLDQLLAMRGGAPSRMDGTTGLDMPADAPRIDAAVGQSMQRSLDQLGFYSAALEAAARWGQTKGTLEQLTAWLKKSGVKDTELQATGFTERFGDRASITRDEAVKFFEDERIALNETVRRTDQEHLFTAPDGARYTADDLEHMDDGALEELGMDAEAVNRWLQDTEGSRRQAVSYEGNSLDGDNPTYRETVLHLPVEKHGDMGVPGHFPEPNIIGHMQTSLTLKGNARVFTLDQIQSDWGQRIRDFGALDQEKAERLGVERSELFAKLDELVGRAEGFLPREGPYRLYYNDAATLARMAADDLRLRYARQEQQFIRRVTGLGGGDKKMLALADEIDALADEYSRVLGEYRAASMGVTPHPLVNATDQWVNTTLRRAIRQAIEADAQYIAIPTGDTVLSYNPGDTHGMREFYGARAFDPQAYDTLKAEVERASFQAHGQRGSMEQVPYDEAANERYRDLADRLHRMENRGPSQTGIVPKNLRNILQKIDKTIVPEFVETLDSPSGKKNLGHGFTIFPLTDKVRQSVLNDGLPMFAVHGGDEQPTLRLDPQMIEAAQKLADRLGVKLPDLSGLDIDQAMAAIGKGVQSMMARAQRGAKASTEDVADLLAQANELRWFADASDGDLESVVRETIAKLTGSDIARQINPYDPIFKEGPSGPTQARALKIDDLKVADFLDDDIERIATYYVRNMAPDVALTREFGDLNLTEDLRRIEDEVQARVDAAATAAEKMRIRREGDKRVADIRKVVSRLRGTYANQGIDPTSWGPRTAAVVKQANILRLMGSVLASSISDTAKTLFVHGFRHNADLFATLISNYQGLKLAKHEAKEMSAGLEFLLSRSGQMWDAFDDMAVGHSMPERALRYATNKFGRLNLMDAWNSHLKQLSGAMTANRVLRASVDLANGTISRKDLTKLASASISPDIARVIAQQYLKHGTAHGRLWLANAGAWDDTPEALMAKQTLQSAVRREADLMIVTPGQEKPLWTSTHLGSVLGQFRTFNMVSIQRTLIAGLQEADAAKMVALMGMIGLGMLSEQLKIIIHGKEQKRGPKDMGEWLYAGLANSGALGWLMDADQAAHKISGGNISVARRVFGNDRPISRYASQNITGALLGPSLGAAEDLIRAARAVTSGDRLTEGDIHAMRRLAPYQNLFYISRGLRALEDGLIDAWGIPRSQQRN